MNQLALIPCSRKTDPGSSHEAEAAIRESGRLENQQKMVLEAVHRWPGSTAKEIDGRLFGQVESHKRLASLCDQGYIVRGARRKCRVTGFKVATWWPVVERNAA